MFAELSAKRIGVEAAERPPLAGFSRLSPQPTPDCLLTEDRRGLEPCACEIVCLLGVAQARAGSRALIGRDHVHLSERGSSRHRPNDRDSIRGAPTAGISDIGSGLEIRVDSDVRPPKTPELEHCQLLRNVSGYRRIATNPEVDISRGCRSIKDRTIENDADRRSLVDVDAPADLFDCLIQVVGRR
jgi:hypothetical protein